LQLTYRPQKDERLSRPSWLTCSGPLTHVVTRQLQVERMDSESSPKVSERPTFYQLCHHATRLKAICFDDLTDRSYLVQPCSLCHNVLFAFLLVQRLSNEYI